MVATPTPATPQFTPEQLISASLLRLGTSDRNPFFASLALMAPVVISDAVDTAATDGERLYFNPQFLSGLSPTERDGVIVHEVLHAALLHVTRCADRQPLLWNIACDIVVNGMVATDARLALPAGVVRDATLEHLSVEEVYEVLIRSKNTLQKHLGLQDLRPDLRDLTSGSGAPSNPDGGSTARGSKSDRPEETDGLGQNGSPGQTGSKAAEPAHASKASRSKPTKTSSPQSAPRAPGPMDAELRRRIEDRWNQVVAQAAAVALAKGQMPAAVQRQFGKLLSPQVDWRTRLWQYLVRTPDDFTGFDRRMIWHGLYVEQLEGESVRVDVCVDTSGSIDQQLLSAFLSEVKGIVNAYERIEVRLYYADAECHGPYPLSKADQGLPTPKGGGGTDFRPFFTETAHHQADQFGGMRLLVYLTDGHGAFPRTAPDHPCLWVVTPGGLSDAEFPFGEVVRMS